MHLFKNAGEVILRDDVVVVLLLEEQELVTAERERDEQKTEREDKTMMKNPYVCILYSRSKYE